MFKYEINLINKTLYLMHLLIKGLTVRKENLIYKEEQKNNRSWVGYEKAELIRTVWNKIKELF
jgi:hypothetical protein